MKWEYEIFSFPLGAAVGGHAGRVYAFRQWLNNIGEEGWELVSHDRLDPSQPPYLQEEVCIFKRQVEEVAP